MTTPRFTLSACARRVLRLWHPVLALALVTCHRNAPWTPSSWPTMQPGPAAATEPERGGPGILGSVIGGSIAPNGDEAGLPPGLALDLHTSLAPRVAGRSPTREGTGRSDPPMALLDPQGDGPGNG